MKGQLTSYDLSDMESEREKGVESIGLEQWKVEVLFTDRESLGESSFDGGKQGPHFVLRRMLYIQLGVSRRYLAVWFYRPQAFSCTN